MCSSLGIVVGGLSALICIMPFLSIGMTSNYHWYQITSSDWPFVSAVLGQMAHLVTSITLNSARSGSIRFDSFLPLVLLWLVIVVVVVGVGVMVVVVVAVIVVVKGWAYAFHQDNASSVTIIILKRAKGNFMVISQSAKNKSFDSIQKMFDRAFKRVNTFVDFRTDLVEAELKSLMEVILNKEEVALDAIPLDVKSSSIVDWKIHKEGKKSYY
ncbi:hypothetical protein Tco_0216955 [Tanacetum coccineum]